MCAVGVLITAIDFARPKHISKILGEPNTHGWMTADLLRYMGGSEKARSLRECCKQISSDEKHSLKQRPRKRRNVGSNWLSTADLESLQHTALEKYVWVKKMKARSMMVDKNKNTRWKPKWRWDNRGCVWEKLASEWAAADYWTETRRICTSKMETRDFVTFILTFGGTTCKPRMKKQRTDGSWSA